MPKNPSFGKLFGFRTKLSIHFYLMGSEWHIQFAFIGMPRKQLIRTNENPYHVNARSNNKDWFIPNLKICYDIFLEVLEKTIEKYEFEVHHFLLMDNHFHMIVSTPLSNIDKGMRYFMTEVSRRIARTSGRINKIFGQRYHWTLITDSTQYAHVVKYLYRNPIEANMVSKCEQHLHSSLKPPNKIFKENSYGFNEHLPTDLKEYLDWINEPYLKDVHEVIRKALNKPIFKISKSRINNQKVDLKTYLKNSNNAVGSQKSTGTF